MDNTATETRSAMKKILLWLASIERKAAELYEQASVMFAGDPGFSRLLKELGDDEWLHYTLVCRAAEAVEGGEHESIISMDAESVQKILAPFAELESLLGQDALTKDKLLEYVALVEFSELNGIFLYAIEAMRARSAKEVLAAAQNIAQHKDRIRRYLETNPGYEALLEKIDSFPKLSAERILVVDSKKVNAGILKAVLETEGEIECALDGTEALRKIDNEAYSVVLITLEAEECDGIELYRTAVERHPAMKDRFVFLTSSADRPEYTSFFKRHHIAFLKKPAPVKDIREKVRKALKAGEN